MDLGVSEARYARYVAEPLPVEVVLARLEGPGFPDGSVDLVPPVNTYHQIDDRLALAELCQAGYRHTASHPFLPVQIFEVFAPEPSGE